MTAATTSCQGESQISIWEHIQSINLTCMVSVKPIDLQTHSSMSSTTLGRNPRLILPSVYNPEDPSDSFHIDLSIDKTLMCF